ncbi:hypothetical protein M3J09_001420 [Ascochyta lentis]
MMYRKEGEEIEETYRPGSIPNPYVEPPTQKQELSISGALNGLAHQDSDCWFLTLRFDEVG